MSSLSAHRHTPLALPAWECLQAGFWPLSARVGGKEEQQAGVLACPCLTPSRVPELLFGRPCLCREHMSFPENRKGREGKPTVLGSRTTCQHKGQTRAKTKCGLSSWGKEWHRQPLRDLVTADLGMSVRFVAVQPLPAAQPGLPRAGTNKRSLFRFLSGTCWSLEN